MVHVRFCGLCSVYRPSPSFPIVNKVTSCSAWAQVRDERQEPNIRVSERGRNVPETSARFVVRVYMSMVTVRSWAVLVLCGFKIFAENVMNENWANAMWSVPLSIRIPNIFLLDSCWWCNALKHAVEHSNMMRWSQIYCRALKHSVVLLYMLRCT